MMNEAEIGSSAFTTQMVILALDLVNEKTPIPPTRIGAHVLKAPSSENGDR